MRPILGLTGGYCSGKDSAASYIVTRGVRIVDVDRLGHESLGLSASRLAETFGGHSLRPDGQVDRRALGAMVFGNPELLHKLETIVHPVMLTLLDQALEGDDPVCINAALLYKFPQLSRCDLVIEIRAPLPIRLERGMARDGLPKDLILERIASQNYLWNLRPLTHPPVVFVDNDGAFGALEHAIDRILETCLPGRGAAD